MKLKPITKIFLALLPLQFLIIYFTPGLVSKQTDALLLCIITVLFAMIFLFGTFRIESSLATSQSKFNAVYFGMMGLRMLTAFILIFIYLSFSGLSKIPGIIFLICNYFVYMGFEIRFILPKLRTDSEKSKNTDDARK